MEHQRKLFPTGDELTEDELVDWALGAIDLMDRVLKADNYYLPVNEELSKDERSLLLYLESNAVDYGGKLDARRMNKEDFDILKRWNDEGFVRFGRIAARDIQKLPSHIFDHWVVLSEAAWEAARQERRARNVRVEGKLNVHRNGYDEEE